MSIRRVSRKLSFDIVKSKRSVFHRFEVIPRIDGQALREDEMNDDLQRVVRPIYRPLLLPFLKNKNCLIRVTFHSRSREFGRLIQLINDRDLWSAKANAAYSFKYWTSQAGVNEIGHVALRGEARLADYLLGRMWFSLNEQLLEAFVFDDRDQLQSVNADSFVSGKKCTNYSAYVSNQTQGYYFTIHSKAAGTEALLSSNLSDVSIVGRSSRAALAREQGA